MAAPIAYEEPTLNKAWQAFLNHLPTLAIVMVCQIGIGLVGAILVFVLVFVASLVFGSAVTGGSSEQISIITQAIANIIQFPFLILSNLIGVLVMAVPAMHYESGLTISPSMALGALWRRPIRFLLAGLLFTAASTIGFLLCIVPGVVVALVLPVYVNRIFNTNEPIPDAFSGSFQAVYKSERGLQFVGVELLTALVVTVSMVCTCFVGGLVTVPMAFFFLQNSAYRHGVLR